MPTNLATIIGGPCLIQFDGSTFRSKDDVTLSLALDTFDIVTDLYGAVDKRVSGQPLTLSFTPEGRFADLSVLFPYVSAAIGSLITPRHVCGAVDATANTVAVSATTLAAGTPISFGTTGVMPTGLSAATLYYLSANAAGLRTIHLSAAAAIAGTAPVDITVIGSGTLAFVLQKTLVILGNDGTRYTFHNAAVTKMPAIKFSALETLWGAVEFESFPKNGIAWATAASLYTIDTATFADTGFDPADILTQPHTITWGAAPWALLYTKAGISVENTLGLEPIDDDASGIISRRIASLGFTAKAQPMGPSLADVMTALTLQGAGATRGRSLAGSDFVIEGAGVYCLLNAAALSGGPGLFSSKNDRVGELTWQATRSFTSGVADDLFYIGAAAPV